MLPASTLIFLIVFGLQGSWCLKVTQLEVVPHVPRNEDVKLTCHFTSPNKHISSIKWFHNDVQFYRYMPSEDPPTEFYPVDGENGEPLIKVDRSRSNGTEIYLTDVNLSASGTYRCMVTGDAPMFLSDSEEANLTVTVIPDGQPNLEGEVHRSYRPGNTVTLNCTSAPSVPPAKLVWIVNDKQASPDIVELYTSEPRDDGLVVSKLGLKLKLTQQNFIEGELKLKCTATIASLYHKSNEHSQQKHAAPLEAPKDLPTQEASTKNDTGSGHVVSMSRVSIFLLPLLLLLR
ncbi:unnamed protein product [Meganyctiphanes norvegica]|uniref:Ig-like domain-containing protein n=1 Tax=Meganyctiphanes norvegica TaxID=48144 RepID=A0AAV2RPL1_MEGNR